MSYKLWKLLSIRIKTEDHNGKIHWYDETDTIAYNIDLEYELEDLINKQGGTFDEDKVGIKEE